MNVREKLLGFSGFGVKKPWKSRKKKYENMKEKKNQISTQRIFSFVFLWFMISVCLIILFYFVCCSTNIN